jgi:hypothetical protein
MSELPALPAVHETQTDSGITIADPDQGTPHVCVHLAVPGVFIHVWEPFVDGRSGGHDLPGFLERWEEWAAGDANFLFAREPRFGFPLAIPRSVLDWVTQITIEYRRKEDTRAGVRSPLLAPHVREGKDGVIELLIPR